MYKRQGEGCWHATDPEPEADPLPTPVPTDGQDQFFVQPVEQLAAKPAPPPVYTDFFPVGMIPAETCPYHQSRAMASTTPSATAGDAPYAPAVSIQTISRPDGTTGILLKGGGQP